MTAIETGHGDLMDQVYRRQRHIYDMTRKFYLLGRDRLIADLAPPAGGTVLEIGCGTGRNLAAVAHRYPDARLFGLDISGEMLRTAGARIAREGLTGRVRIAQADATAAEPGRIFGLDGFDRVYFSYTLSMIPDWRTALARSVAALGPGGRLHIVDFGAQEGLPRLFRQGLYRWLDHFHVVPRPAAFYEELRVLAAGRRASTRQVRPYLGYAWSAVLTMPGRTAGARTSTEVSHAGSERS
jgi:S-adenosylmethionine-diacylgycerolhomoserine-N-methlytransferase